MSGAFPISSAGFQVATIKTVQKTLLSKSASGKRFARQIDGQKFGFTASIITGKRSDIYGDLMAFIMKQRSGKESFTIIPPEISSTRGTETGTLLVNNAHTAGDTTITIDGHSSDAAGVLKSGDFIKFAGHDKVYMIVSDVTSSSNASTITIEPPLTTALSNNEVITYNNVPFTVYLLNDMQEFGQIGADSSGNVLYKFELDVEEAL
jgi:hypothetical protein|tara:strand:+ start:857 stop:1477 length:621 start_codon:yes stop_codon:yes gene_type:complete